MFERWIEVTLLPTMLLSMVITFLRSADEDKFAHTMCAMAVSACGWILVACLAASLIGVR